MDIHRPKAAHSIREFLIEIGTIICGILIALGLEQALEWVHTQREIAETREALRNEIALNASIGLMRAETGRCLLAWVDREIAWAKGGTRPLPASISWTPLSTTVWDASRSSGVLKLSTEERLKYARYYVDVQHSETSLRQVADFTVRSDRYTMLARLNADQASRLVEEMNSGRRWMASVANSGRYTVDAAKQFGVRIQEPGPVLKRLVTRLCEVAGAPPPTYRLDGEFPAYIEWYMKVVEGQSPPPPGR